MVSTAAANCREMHPTAPRLKEGKRWGFILTNIDCYFNIRHFIL